MAKKTMTASESITDGQIDAVMATIRAALTKNRSDFSGEAFQLALGLKNLGMILLAPLRTEVEKFSKIVRRTVTVDRALSPEAAIAATGRKQYVTAEVLAAMPKGEGDTVVIEFIPLEKWMNNEAVDDKFAEHGLVPVDPFALAAHNAAEPDFASERPCFTHWKNADGNWCYAAFLDWSGERGVNVLRDASGWRVGWWAAGVRK